MTESRSRSPISLWDASAEETDFASEFPGDCSVDLAIVGGGYTGLSTALHGAKLGLDCHVLEAKHIGYGGSGQNTGLVNAGLWLPPQDVRERLGEEVGSSFIKAFGEAPAYVLSLIEEHQIRCEATRSGTIHAAHSPGGYEDLARRAEEWHRLGAPVDPVEAVGLDGDMLEAQAFAYLAVRVLRGLPTSAPSTTGCRAPVCGGRVS